MKRTSEIMRAVSDGNSCRPPSGCAAGRSTPPLSRRTSRRRARAIALALAVGLAAMLVTTSARAQTEKVLRNFTGAPADGASPEAGLISDSSGNLYGTTYFGGILGATCDGSGSGCGTVFELVKSSRSYTEKVLYRFTGKGGDGSGPDAGLVMDAAGNLYGTTENGGTLANCNLALGGKYGCGTVFELVKSSGGYTEKVLHTFTGGDDGANPEAGLVMDSSGNLYGTTYAGGASNASAGTVFELVKSSGTYTEKILHSFFASSVHDGAEPEAGLIMDSSGNLYGTTYVGGVSGLGTVFEMRPPIATGLAWTETVLYSFTFANGDGSGPQAGLLMDSSGSLYGTTILGGAGGYYGDGIVFELVKSSGRYKEKVLHSFMGGDGHDPQGGLVMDSSGNLYGTTLSGGALTNCAGGCGTVFELAKSSRGYTEKVLHRFTGRGGDGAILDAGLLMDSSGNLFGTTEAGGPTAEGSVFELAAFPGGMVAKQKASVKAARPPRKSSQISFYANFGGLYGYTSRWNRSTSGSLVVRPSMLYLTEDGSTALLHLKWSGWGTSVAYATGTWSASTGYPDMADGKRITSPARITLSSPGLVLGHMLYRCFLMDAPNSKRHIFDHECMQRQGSYYSYGPVRTH